VRENVQPLQSAGEYVTVTKRGKTCASKVTIGSGFAPGKIILFAHMASI